VSPLQQHGIQATVESQPDLQLSDLVAALLYRTAREAVRNVQEHAEARTLELRVAQENGRVSLSVADDGRGFAPADALARPAEGHFGLRLLHDQVRDAGGTLEIDSAPGRGAKLTVEVPAS
jgi:signal transduction histidine kinase